MKYEPLPRQIENINIVEDGEIRGILRWQNKRHHDERGSFGELIRFRDLTPYLPKPFPVAQMNITHNTRTGTLRGIHVSAWEKIIFLPQGEANLVFVDLRVGSPTYGRVSINHVFARLNTGFYIPAGIGNAYLTLSDDTEYLYLTSILWNPEYEIAIKWDDPSLNINWGIWPKIISRRDREAKPLKELIPDFDKLVAEAK
jgi:dTDP-4-dehydrorhamnose 3,5-epimerase